MIGIKAVALMILSFGYSAVAWADESTAIVGKWKGTAQAANSPVRFEVEFKPDGTFVGEAKAESGWFKNEGRWRYENGVFLTEGTTAPASNQPIPTRKGTAKIVVTGDKYEATSVTPTGETRTTKAERVK